MSVKIDVTLDLSALDRVASPESVDAAQQLLAERILQHCKPLVPKDTGALRESCSVGDSGKEIAWTVEYAQYVYNMEDVNWTTSGTCGHWFEAAKSQHLDDWKQVVEEALA